jgi:hypothetical protein
MKSRIICFLLLVVFGNCVEREDPVPVNTQLLRNFDLEMSPDNVLPWRAASSSPFRLGVSTEVFRSPNRALYITNSDSTARTAAGWSQIYSGEMPREGRRLRLTAFLKGENIVRHRPGSNVYLAIRTFPVEGRNSSTFGRFVSTQQIAVVSGTFDWAPLNLTLPAIQNDVQSIAVYLVMAAGTTGTIYFDDITLTVE